jgi:multiple sugar transport system permease protein
MIEQTRQSMRMEKSLRLGWKLERKFIPYLFIAPFFIVFIIFFLGPAIFAFFVSFQNWNLLGAMKFIGFKNYILLFHDKTFGQAVFNSLVYILSAIVVQWPLSLMLATIMNQKHMPGKKFLTPIYFIPVLTSSVVIAIVFVLFLDKKYGLFNVPFISLGLQPINWLGSTELSKFAVILLLVWRWSGYNMILFLASMQAIPQELYEAAWVDGAGKVQSWWNITVPLLRPAIAYVVIMGMIGGWQIFDEPWILTNKGGPADSSLSVGNFLYRMSIINLRMGYGSAIGTILFVVIFVFTIFQLRFFGLYSKEEQSV